MRSMTPEQQAAYFRVFGYSICSISGSHGNDEAMLKIITSGAELLLKAHVTASTPKTMEDQNEHFWHNSAPKNKLDYDEDGLRAYFLKQPNQKPVEFSIVPGSHFPKSRYTEKLEAIFSKTSKNGPSTPKIPAHNVTLQAGNILFISHYCYYRLINTPSNAFFIDISKLPENSKP